MLSGANNTCTPIDTEDSKTFTKMFLQLLNQFSPVLCISLTLNVSSNRSGGRRSLSTAQRIEAFIIYLYISTEFQILAGSFCMLSITCLNAISA